MNWAFGWQSLRSRALNERNGGASRSDRRAPRYRQVSAERPLAMETTMNRPRSQGGFWRGYLLGGATLVLVGLLWHFASQPPAAYAQVPDSGAQRNRMIQEQVTTNKKLAEIVDLLKEIRDQNKAEPAAKKPGPTRP